MYRAWVSGQVIAVDGHNGKTQDPQALSGRVSTPDWRRGPAWIKNLRGRHLGLIIIVYVAWGLLLFIGPWWGCGPSFGGCDRAAIISAARGFTWAYPFRSLAKNTAMAWVSLSVVIPYTRFRDTHLAHHYDPLLTDPYEDPETNYLDPVVWHGLPRMLHMDFAGE